MITHHKPFAAICTQKISNKLKFQNLFLNYAYENSSSISSPSIFFIYLYFVAKKIRRLTNCSNFLLLLFCAKNNILNLLFISTEPFLYFI